MEFCCDHEPDVLDLAAFARIDGPAVGTAASLWMCDNEHNSLVFMAREDEHVSFCSACCDCCRRLKSLSDAVWTIRESGMLRARRSAGSRFPCCWDLICYMHQPN